MSSGESALSCGFEITSQKYDGVLNLGFLVIGEACRSLSLPIHKQSEPKPSTAIKPVALEFVVTFGNNIV